MHPLKKYFHEISDTQLMQFTIASHTYQEWNQKINVISRKDMDNIMIHHMLHSLGIAKVIQFSPNTTVADIGTGGGFPGIPLAIMFPKVKFTLIDSINKKLIVANEVVKACGLKNVTTLHERAEKVIGKFDFVTGRAVETIPDFYNHVKHLIQPGAQSSLENGILYLKGGDFSSELNGFNKKIIEYKLQNYFEEEFFETKKVVYIPYQ